MKILQINSVCGAGSTGRITTDLYKVLEEHGYECCIAYGRGVAPSGINTIKIGSALDYIIHGIYTRITDKNGFGSKKATERFIKQIEEYNPDIIQMHNIHGYYINIEILFRYLQKANIPIIWSVHDCWPITGHCTHFDFVECYKWKNGCNKCPQKGLYPSSLLFDNSEENYRKKKNIFTSVRNMTIVTASKWLTNLIEQSFLGKYPVKIISNGIDLDAFKPTQSDFRKTHNLNDKFIILGVATAWAERKGLSDFVELSKKLDAEFKIVLVGLTTKQLKQIPKNIIGISRTNNVKELAEIYTAADVFVNLSVEESMGLVTVEALACGTPAIVYNATAVPEAVDETCGIVVEKGNVSGIAEAIIYCKEKKFHSDDCIKRADLYEKKKKYEEYINQYALSAGR